MAGTDELVGLTGPQIAAKVATGELTEKAALDFVAARARKKLQNSIKQLRALQPQQA